MKPDQILDVNCEPLSLMMSSGLLKYQNTWLKSNSAVMNTVGKPCRGMRHNDLENQFMITRMMVLFDLGRSVMKSAAMWDHGHCDVWVEA